MINDFENFQVGRRAEEFSEAQHTMRESVVERSNRAVEVEDSSPIPPDSTAGGDFGGK